MFKNTASQSVTLYAVDASTGLPKTGDSANMVFYVSKDDGSVTAISSNSGVPTESDSTNAKGDYKIAVSQTETNADKLRFSGKSSTSNIVVVPQTIYTTPASFTSLNVTNVNTLTGHDPGATLGTGTSTLTQAQITGGAYTIQSASCVLGDARIANLDTTVSSRGTSTLTQTQVTGGAYNVQSASCVLGDTRIAHLDADISSRGTSTLTQTQITGGVYTIQSASCVLGDTRIAHLDADVSSRMATYTQPTGFLATTFPTGTVANTTNITAGTITTTTNLTNAPTAGDFTSTMKTSLNAATPAVTVSDKTGFSLTQAFPSNFASLGITVAGKISEVVLCDTITTYTGDTPQTGDSYARIGSTGSGLTSLAQSSIWTSTVANHIDVDVSSRLASSSYTAPLTAATTRSAIGLSSANLDTQLALIDTDVLTRLASSSYTSPPTVSQIWTTALTESYATDGAAFTPAQGLFMVWSALSEFSISGTTITAKKLDGATTAMTFTMDDGTNPTSRTRAS